MKASMLLHSLAIVTVGIAVVLYAQSAWATYPPPPGMIERMKQAGTFDDALRFAKSLGNHKQKTPKRGALVLEDYTAEHIADLIAANMGRSLDGERDTSAIGRSTSKELDWVELDLNHDRVVDERDLLALGLPRPKTTAGLPSLGTDYMPVLLIDFSDYPHYFETAHIQEVMFGAEGDGQTWFRGLHYFYDKSSHGQLNIDGEALGWYTAKHPRTYYHPDDSNWYPESGARQAELLNEAVTAFDQSGTDFSKFDNDGDGYVDQLTVIWSGPNGDWATFWWGYQTWWGDSPVIDGVRFGSYSWQWERGYYFGSEPPLPEYWDAGVVVHETGHALGIPDYYDYDGSVGPQGGVGGMDIMGGWSGEHGCYSKYVLGWLNPTVASVNLGDELMEHAHTTPDCVLFMPGFDPVSPWTEYFMSHSRKRELLDTTLPNDGMVIWHVDATVHEGGWTNYDNSYTPHKLLRLMEADGLEEIENGLAGANEGDFYQPGSSLGPDTLPSSAGYNGPTGMTLDNIVGVEGGMTADFTLYASNPPSVSIVAPAPESTLSGIVPVQLSASDDTALSKVQLLSDGVLLAQWESGALNYLYSWNTLPEFNKSLVLEARAYDSDGQMASDSFSITVNNAGLSSFGDDYESGLEDWRVINIPETMGGHFTRWDLRESPADPIPTGSGSEAFVSPYGRSDWWHASNDRLRSPRIDASAFTHALHVRFAYRCRDGFRLYKTTDNGQTWEEVEKLAQTWEWAQFNRGLEVQGEHVYLELRYSGSIHPQEGNAWGAHLDSFSAGEALSDPPQLQFTSHVAGETLSGVELLGVDAIDDTGIALVDFYVNGGHAFSDTEAPYEYERITQNDDDHPGIPVRAIAEDIDGIRSAPAQLTLSWDNERSFPMEDDLEAGDLANWVLQNDGLWPNWELGSSGGTLGDYSLKWFGAGQYEQHNSDGVWYIGPPVAEGRQCVDLANADCISPVLTFKYKNDLAPGAAGAVYFYTDWEGWHHVGDWLSGTNLNTDNEWVETEISLERFVGYSGRLAWWLWTGEDTNGTGMWIDEVEVSNKYTRGPEILSTPPGRQSGEELTLHGRFFLDTGGSVGLGVNDMQVLSWDVGDITVMLEGEPGEYGLSVETRLGQISEPYLYTLVEPLAVSLAGLDEEVVYINGEAPAIEVTTAEDAERVELLIDGSIVGAVEFAPFGGLTLAVDTLHNGDHSVQLRATRRSIVADSNVVVVKVFTLRGDVNGDGFVDGLDAGALALYIGLKEGDADFRPWYDCDEDGVVTELDQAYIGYFGSVD